MTVPLTIAAAERRVLRLFALDLTPAEVAAIAEPDPASGEDGLARLLGVKSLVRGMTEVFDVKDVQALGLSQYLISGNGIPPAQIAADRAVLDALRGPVLTLFSEAFETRPVTLQLDPRLRLIATYAEDLPPVVFEPLPSPDATGLLPQGKPVWSDARMGGMVATAALIFIALFTLAFIWMA